MAIASSEAELTESMLQQCIAKAQSRIDLWKDFIRLAEVRRMAEIGVYRGDFAASVMRQCDELTHYYMLDPWRHLAGWNKPANEDNAIFESFFEEAKGKTDFAAAKRVILRGKTTEVIQRIPDGALDLAYVDGDHTLRGIAIDLIRVYPKIREGGFLCGDDFRSSIWEHNTRFEPTLVFPFAVYFAEAVGATIYGLPYAQFCLHKTKIPDFRFVDLTRQYGELELRSQFVPKNVLKLMVGERYPRLKRFAGSLRSLFSK